MWWMPSKGVRVTAASVLAPFSPTERHGPRPGPRVTATAATSAISIRASSSTLRGPCSHEQWRRGRLSVRRDHLGRRRVSVRAHDVGKDPRVGGGGEPRHDAAVALVHGVLAGDPLGHHAAVARHLRGTHTTTRSQGVPSGQAATTQCTPAVGTDHGHAGVVAARLNAEHGEWARSAAQPPPRSAGFRARRGGRRNGGPPPDAGGHPNRAFLHPSPTRQPPSVSPPRPCSRRPCPVHGGQGRACLSATQAAGGQLRVWPAGRSRLDDVMSDVMALMMTAVFTWPVSGTCQKCLRGITLAYVRCRGARKSGRRPAAGGRRTGGEKGDRAEGGAATAVRANGGEDDEVTG